MNNLVIAIDGYSSCGKSTIAKALAAKFGFSYIDSGAMYRAVTLYFMQNNIPLENENKVTEALKNIEIAFVFNSQKNGSDTYLNNINVEKEIRSLEVSNNVSEVSAIKAVRVAMVDLQRKAAKNVSVVMDGRDIGTHVFPDANLKIFMTAKPEVRAERRFLELKAKGESISLEDIKANLLHRDTIDTTRVESPLVCADDAILLDNSNLTPDEQLALVGDWIMTKVIN